MKKIILCLLLLTSCIILVGCGKNGESTGILGGKSSKVEYKDYDDNGQIDYHDKIYALSQAGGINIEYKSTNDSAESEYQISAKDNLLLLLNNGKGSLFEFTGETGNQYKYDNGTWQSPVKMYKNALFDDGLEEAFRKDLYAELSSYTQKMERYIINENNKKEEIKFLGRKCTKYQYNSNNSEIIVYVDNETELPLYCKKGTKEVQVTKFETTGVKLSVPQV